MASGGPRFVNVGEGSSSASPALDIAKAAPGACDPCVVGDWSVDMSNFEAYFQGFTPQELAMNGTYTVSHAPADEGLAYTDQRAWVMTFPGSGASFSIDIDAGGAGTYSADGTTFTISGYNQTVTAGVNVPVGGASATDGGISNGSFPYTCEGDVFTIQVEDWPLTATRIQTTVEGEGYFR